MRDLMLGAALAMLVLLGLWCLLGRMLLPVRRGARLMYVLQGEEAQLERQVRLVSWLRGCGLFDGTLVLLTKDRNAAHLPICAALARQYAFVELRVIDDAGNETVGEEDGRTQRGNDPRHRAGDRVPEL